MSGNNDIPQILMERPTELPRIQEFHKAFNAYKDGKLRPETYSDQFFSNCMMEELGEFLEKHDELVKTLGRLARCIKKGQRAEANGLMDEVLRWRKEMLSEGADILIYLIMLFNKHDADMSEAFYEKMDKNLREVLNGGGKFLGKDETVT